MTTTSDILARLRELASKRFGDKAADLDADVDFFEALGIDSLQALDLLTDLEEAFDVEVPDYELADVTTFAGLAAVLEDRL
ncbi:MAG: acyl carrier protein [Deltaproteobacteria bacterium]|nr:MAG: acyl carrier protein [Deltaproteobacteria bacterium]